MIDSQAFRLIRIISEDRHLKLCRVMLHSHRQTNPVLIKLSAREASSAAEEVLLLREFDNSVRVYVNGIMKPIALKRIGSLLALVYEDNGSISLREYINRGVRLELGEFLRLAKKMVLLIRELHQFNAIHLDLRPDHFLIDPVTMNVQLTGLSYARFMTFGGHQREDVLPMSEDGLPYTSPENTGRLQQGVDGRSDLYSLGVIFYEMLSGNMPYQASEPLEWIHAHLAQTPLPLVEHRKDVPSAISYIIMKLLEKNTDNRYSTCSALLTDLDKIDEWHHTFAMTNDLYGREAEMSLLSQAFQSTCFGSTEIVYVYGDAGIGKTSLLEEVFQKHQNHSRDLFYITGKFEQFTTDSPYHPIIHAFRGFMKNLLGESSESIEGWRCKLREALRSNEAVIAAIIPEVKLLIGDMAAVEELPPDESKKRFIYTFRKFVQVLAAKEHPLVLFIDDLQWADTSSLQLIHSLLCDPESQYLMFVGAYRDTEMGQRRLPGYEEDGSVSEEVIVHHIHLRNLTLTEMNLIVRDSLHCHAEDSLPLTEVLYHNSGGNPFHFKQIFQRIQDDRLLTYRPESQRWQWNLGHIMEQESLFAVNDLMTHKLRRISSSAQEILEIASCIGSSFQAAVIAGVSGRSIEEVLDDLAVAADEGLVLSQGTNHYRFLHDSIQTFMYKRMYDKTRQQCHLLIGRRLWERVQEQSENLFNAVNHLNFGLAAMSDPKEIHQLIEMNLAAGNQAKASTAYDMALVYYRKGVELLSADDWDTHYPLCFELNAERAECEYLCGNHELTEELVEDLLRNAHSPIDRVRLQMIRITQFINLGKYSKATALGLSSLKEFRINVSPTPTKAAVFWEVLRTHILLGNRYSRLAALPEMTDKNLIAAMNMIFSMAASSFFTNKRVFCILMCKAIQLSLKYGKTPVSAAVYSGYGMLLGIILGRYEQGYRIAKIGFDLSERYDVTSCKGKTHMIFGGVLCQFVGNPREGDVYLKKALRFGMESGDYVFSSYAMGAHVNSLYTRASVNVLSKTIAEYLVVLAETKDEFVLQNFYLYRQFILALQQQTTNPCSFDSEEFEENRFLEHIYHQETSATTLFQYNTYKTQLCYLNGNYQEALHWARQAKPFTAYATHLPHLPECLFYESLAILSLYGSPSSLPPYKKSVAYIQRCFTKWAKRSPVSFRAKQYLIEARVAQAMNHYSTAEVSYDKAIREAREQEHFQTESVACELAANYYISQGREKAALSYLQAAREGYQLWGIPVKVVQIEKRIAELQGNQDGKLPCRDEQSIISHPALETSKPADLHKSENAVDWVDLAAILKAAQAIANKIDLAAVLVEIMGTLMKYAGAQKGALLTEQSGDLSLQVYAETDVHILAVPTDVNDSNDLPVSIARYVSRTKETVHYFATKDSWLQHNPYMVNHRPQSAICMPVKVHGATVGVLYLENKLASGVFSPERIHILHAMASQGIYICELLRSLPPQVNEAVVDKMTTKTPAVISEPLTDRELEVLALLAAGLSNKEIADRLIVAVGTVKVHVKNIFTKLKVNRRTKAIAQAKELQLLDRTP